MKCGCAGTNKQGKSVLSSNENKYSDFRAEGLSVQYAIEFWPMILIGCMISTSASLGSDELVSHSAAGKFQVDKLILFYYEEGMISV